MTLTQDTEGLRDADAVAVIAARIVADSRSGDALEIAAALTAQLLPLSPTQAFALGYHVRDLSCLAQRLRMPAPPFPLTPEGRTSPPTR